LFGEVNYFLCSFLSILWTWKNCKSIIDISWAIQILYLWKFNFTRLS